jgi:hypothetical protein
MVVVVPRSCRLYRAVPVVLTVFAAACAPGTSGTMSGKSVPPSATAAATVRSTPSTMVTTLPAASSPVPKPGGPAASTSTALSAAIPQFLCQAAEQPRDTADAYTGALSSGQLAQATACVYPGTVPEDTSRGLLVTGTKGSAYTLNESASSTSVFVYDGRRGRLTVTVTAEPDGHNWVTGVGRG